MKPVDKLTNIPVKFASIEQYEQYIRQIRHKNTHFALAAYDNFMAKGWRDESVYGTMFALSERDRLARLVGRAFGYDTKHINSPETCEGCVWPDEWLRKTIGAA